MLMCVALHKIKVKYILESFKFKVCIWLVILFYFFCFSFKCVLCVVNSVHRYSSGGVKILFIYYSLHFIHLERYRHTQNFEKLKSNQWWWDPLNSKTHYLFYVSISLQIVSSIYYTKRRGSLPLLVGRHFSDIEEIMVGDIHQSGTSPWHLVIKKIKKQQKPI